MKRRADLIDQFTELVIGADDPRRLAERTLEVVMSLTNGRAGAVFTRGDDRMTLFASRGIDQEVLGKEVEDFLAEHEIIFVVEQNRDAQLRSLLTLETRVEKPRLRSILHYSGLSISSECIVQGVMGEVGEGRGRALGVVRVP